MSLAVLLACWLKKGNTLSSGGCSVTSQMCLIFHVGENSADNNCYYRLHFRFIGKVCVRDYSKHVCNLRYKCIAQNGGTRTVLVELFFIDWMRWEEITLSVVRALLNCFISFQICKSLKYLTSPCLRLIVKHNAQIFRCLLDLWQGFSLPKKSFQYFYHSWAIL